MNNTQEFLIRSATTLILFVCLWIGIFYLPADIFFIPLIIISILIAREWFALCAKTKSLSLWLLSIIYPLGPLMLLALLNQTLYYRPLMFPLFAITALHDVASYIVGKLFGRHLLAPSISPKKTYEGAFGGLCAVFIIIIIYSQYSHADYSFFTLIGISIVWSFSALCGDLFESFLKRKAKIKDSGNLLPGHGGFLDRLDSVLFVCVFIYALRDKLLPLFKVIN